MRNEISKTRKISRLRVDNHSLNQVNRRVRMQKLKQWVTIQHKVVANAALNNWLGGRGGGAELRRGNTALEYVHVIPLEQP